MSSVEAVEWVASMRLDPDEDDRADIRHALMMDGLARLLIQRKRGQPYKGPTAKDFLASLPWRAEATPPKPQTPQELMAKINAAMRALGGRPKRAENDGR